MHFRILRNDCHQWPSAALECTKFVFGRGSGPDPAGGAYSLPIYPAPGGVTNTSVGVLKFGRTVCRRHTERLSLSDKLPTCEDVARQSCALVPRRRRRFLVTFASCISASRLHHISDLHSKFTLHNMCGSMVDIESPTAEIRRAKKRRRRRRRRRRTNHRMKI